MPHHSAGRQGLPPRQLSHPPGPYGLSSSSWPRQQPQQHPHHSRTVSGAGLLPPLRTASSSSSSSHTPHPTSSPLWKGSHHHIGYRGTMSSSHSTSTPSPGRPAATLSSVHRMPAPPAIVHNSSNMTSSPASTAAHTGSSAGETKSATTIQHQNSDADNDNKDLVEENASFDSEQKREVAASVLLLSASAHRIANSANNKSSTTDSSNANHGGDKFANVSSAESDAKEDKGESRESGTARTSAPPLKKRKKVESIMRGVAQASNGTTLSPAAPHVSPVSHGTAGANGVKSDSHTTPPSSHQTHHGQGGRPAPAPTSSTSTGATSHASSSYDLDKGQALPDHAKITSTREICAPPSHVVISHFPTVLHTVLTESEFAGSVLQWLPHGKSWKIVQFNALRRQVLPKYFKRLMEGTKGAGSIDGFLWHLAAWGFEEINEGPDAGAYTHVLFRRGLPRLCQDMRFSPPSEEDEDDAGDKGSIPAMTRNSSSGSHSTSRRGGKSRGGVVQTKDHAHRSILQVPSLVSNAAATGDQNQSLVTPDEEPRRLMQRKGGLPPSIPPPLSSKGSGGSGSAHAAAGWSKGGSVFVQYHSEEMGMNESWPRYYQERAASGVSSASGKVPWVSNPMHVPPRSGTAAGTSSRGGKRSLYPSVRSGRGAARLAAARRTIPSSSSHDSKTSATSTQASSTSVATTPTTSRRSTFPVSNRGKGSKGAAMKRQPIPTTSSGISKDDSKPTEATEKAETTSTPPPLEKDTDESRGEKESTTAPPPASIKEEKSQPDDADTKESTPSVSHTRPLLSFKRKLPMATRTLSSTGTTSATEAKAEV